MRIIGKIIKVCVEEIIMKIDDNFQGVFVGDYVQIVDESKVIIAELMTIDYNSSIMVGTLKLVGEIRDGKFEFGAVRMPNILTDVLSLEESVQESIIAGSSGPSLYIGKSMIYPTVPICVNIDKFFGFHFAIFGNTGAGKSNTFARIVQNIFKDQTYPARGAKIVVIDTNGEYDEAFNKLSAVNPKIATKTISADHSSQHYRKLEIPVWLLTSDDWAILLHATEQTQIPVINRAVEIAKIFFDNKSNREIKNHILATTILGVINSSDSSPSKIDKLTAIVTKFRTDEINLNQMITSSIGLKQSFRVSIKNDNGQIKDVEAVQMFCESFILDDISTLKSNDIVRYDLSEFCQALELAVLYEGSISSTRIQEYTSSMISRVQSLRDSDMGKVFARTGYYSTEEYVTALFDSMQLLNIDISGLDDYTSKVVVKVLGKMLFDYVRSQKVKASVPINIIIEEAHRFITEEESKGVLGYNIFERIAKEGRKYGLLLGISSQRPSELSKTIVSQCNNFILHRIQNPDDLQYISHMVPYLSQDMIHRLTYIPTGIALIFGSAVTIPTYVKIGIANPQPDSKNAQIVKKWFE